jgi:esterase/lipase superfamily enzyme
VGAPWWKRWPVWQDDRLRVISVSALDTQEFWALIQHELSVLSGAERTILLFIHGYAVSFERAAIRAAQFGADLKVLGVTAFFSWPSRGRVQDYAPDAASIEASEAPLRVFLEDLSVKSGAERIHVIVHSMGNRGVIRAFNAILAQAADNSKIQFGQIFLAAPDIDAEVFKQLARAYPQLSERTTMYISAHDKALLGAGYLYDYPRAGYKPPTTIVEGIDTVEVSAIDLSFLGHGYISGARPVLTDMHSLMLANTPPERRMGIEAALDPEADLTYWRIKA